MSLTRPGPPAVAGGCGPASAAAPALAGPAPATVPAFEVVKPGIQTTVQDLPGRPGLWGVGVPPSGAWDDLSFSLANRAVGNPPGAAGLEAVLRGPALRFTTSSSVCLAGAGSAATLDGAPVVPGRPFTAVPGQLLDLGVAKGPGLRMYLAIAGGLAAVPVLGSASTFLAGKFGGHQGRALAAGDSLHRYEDTGCEAPRDVTGLLPGLGGEWVLRVVAGPHGAPEHLTRSGARLLFGTGWRVDHRSGRTGVRLSGPPPRWARTDGGEAGLHPSNIHDSPYPVGGIMLAGDTPVVVGPDGPSLGGFVVPAVVVRADRWQLAQARPGDRVRLLPVSPADADAINAARRGLLATLAAPADRAVLTVSPARPGPLLDVPAAAGRPSLHVRRCGDHHLLAEAGPPELDLLVRLWVHLLAQAVGGGRTDGVTELVEGVRSLLIAADETRCPLPALAAAVGRAWERLPEVADVRLPVREVTMPVCLDDALAHQAMARYQASVRPDAPWCPDNVEFIRRVNGLASRQDVFSLVTAATYLVVGLGDVYLGAPVAVPLDPAHRLVTTKYDPARTWTPENAVGIGGVYLCVYGMEGPGGYQLFGRTVPVWRLGSPAPPALPRPGEEPWLLRLFDKLRFVPVTAGELATARAEIASGRRDLETRPATLSAAELAVSAAARAAAGAFTRRRDAAFAAERSRWAARAAGPGRRPGA